MAALLAVLLVAGGVDAQNAPMPANDAASLVWTPQHLPVQQLLSRARSRFFPPASEAARWRRNLTDVASPVALEISADGASLIVRGAAEALPDIISVLSTLDTQSQPLLFKAVILDVPSDRFAMALAPRAGAPLGVNSPTPATAPTSSAAMLYQSAMNVPGLSEMAQASELLGRPYVLGEHNVLTTLEYGKTPAPAAKPLGMPPDDHEGAMLLDLIPHIESPQQIVLDLAVMVDPTATDERMQLNRVPAFGSRPATARVAIAPDERLLLALFDGPLTPLTTMSLRPLPDLGRFGLTAHGPERVRLVILSVSIASPIEPQRAVK
jgi:hypothetical protein